MNKLELDEEERFAIKGLNFLTLKPFIYVVNVDEQDLNKPIAIESLQNEVAVPICAQLESDLMQLSPEEVKEYLADAGVSMTGLDQIIVEAYKILNLVTYFTSGPKETRAWTITKDTKAPQAAGKIHTDFERGFIAADVVNWKDLVDSGSEAAAKEKGLVGLEGKEYVVKDGDVCVFKFNV